MSDARVAEASAPCSVELAGGGLDAGATWASGLETTTVRVAIDRRAWSRVEIGGEGVQVESKDTLQKMSVGSVDEWIAGGRMVAVAHALRASGLETGVRVELQARVPEGSGLGEIVGSGGGDGRSGRRGPRTGAWIPRRSPAFWPRSGARPASAPARPPSWPPCEEGRWRCPTTRGPNGPRGWESTRPGWRSRSCWSTAARRVPGERTGAARRKAKTNRRPGKSSPGSPGELRHALAEGRFEEVVDLFAAEWEARKLRRRPG